MARRPNYGFEKRQKEKRKQAKAERKKEMKEQRKEAAANGEIENPDTPYDDPDIVPIDPSDLGLDR